MEKGARHLSCPVHLEMVARSSCFRSGASAGGGSFCMMELAVMILFITMAGQLSNSRSRMCTENEDLDGCLPTMSHGRHVGFAGLAPYSLCMEPPTTEAMDITCSVAHSLQVMQEPNDGLLVPKPTLCLAELGNQCAMLQARYRTEWTMVTDAASWTSSSFPGCMDDICNSEDNIQYHSGIFDRAAAQVSMSEFSRMCGRLFMVGATPSFFQSNSGNIHFDHVDSDSGNFQLSNFQYNSGYFNFAIDRTAFWTMVPWFVHGMQFHYNAGDGVCRAVQFQSNMGLFETCSDAGFTVGFDGLLGTTMWMDDALDKTLCVYMDSLAENFSTACVDEVSMIGSTTVDKVFTLVAALCKMAHGLLQTLAMWTGMQWLIMAISLTALVCVWWFVQLQMSHLSHSNDLRSRMCRKLQRGSAIKQQRQLIAVLFLCSCANARAMDESTSAQASFLQGITSMTETATRAAVAAEKALERSTATASATGSNEGLSAASRILKSPDTYSGEDPMMFMQWKQQFTSWLCFGDSRYSQALENLEQKSVAPPLTAYNQEETDMSQKLFAVLTSYLRGRCAHLVRAEVKNKDGFRLWHTLCKEYMPNTRQRALALAQALSAYPTFHKDKSALESVLAFEQLVIQYEEASGSSYPLELMSATLIRCCQPKLREQLQLSISEDSTCQEIRDKVLSFERVSKVWSTEQVLKHIQDTTSYTGGTTDGPTPMEVDRIEKGGKGKGKNKKGNAWTYARGRGRGRQNKGKGKGKSKGKNKGKKGGSKGKGKKGGRGNKVAYGQCSNCYEFGHWAKDCPNMVNQVKQEPIGPSATASSSQQAAPKAGSPVVRRVFQFGSAPSSPTSPASTTPAQTRMVVLQDLDNEWMPISNEATDYAESEWVILDSGSDVSLSQQRWMEKRYF